MWFIGIEIWIPTWHQTHNNISHNEEKISWSAVVEVLFSSVLQYCRSFAIWKYFMQIHKIPFILLYLMMQGLIYFFLVQVTLKITCTRHILPAPLRIYEVLIILKLFRNHCYFFFYSLLVVTVNAANNNSHTPTL